MTIYDINFAELYQQHLIACNHYNLPPTKWDKKAVKMAENLVGKPSAYNQQLLQAINVQADETVLDIGVGLVLLLCHLHNKVQRYMPWIIAMEC